jgi:polar amino acid transport system substrate-binding protein
MPQADAQRAGSAAAGLVRVALFLPQYVKDPASGELRGLGTGYIAIAIAPALAARLGAALRFVEYPSPAATIAGLRTGGCDVAFLGVEPARALEVDFTAPLFQFDYTFLVPAGSAVRSIADVDRPGVRIAVVDSHASALALRRRVKQAELVGAALPDQAFELLRTGRADAFALPRDHLLDYSAKLPGSRLLDDSYGVNRVAMAVPKGRADWLAAVCDFAEAAKAAGLVGDAIVRGGLRGYDVAPADRRR